MPSYPAVLPLVVGVTIMILLQVWQITLTRGHQGRTDRRLTALEERMTSVEQDIRPAEMRTVKALLEERFAAERAITNAQMSRTDAKLDEVLECLHDLRSSRQS